MEQHKEYTGEAEWTHPTQPIWVKFYPQTPVRVAHYQAYRAVAKVPAGRKPWSVDNRRIGDELGFASLDAAIAACMGVA